MPDCWLWTVAVVLTVVPNAIVLFRFRRCQKRGHSRKLHVTRATDSREHLLVYLFAMLLPLYDANMGTLRDTVALLSALVLVGFVFWHLDLNYLNIIFAVLGYRLYIVEPEADRSHERSFVILSRRHYLPPGTSLDAYLLSDTIYVEKVPHDNGNNEKLSD